MGIVGYLRFGVRTFVALIVRNGLLVAESSHQLSGIS